jgi:flavin-dependent dehydrogenase
MTDVAEQYDVVVVGGGPAGSCAAGLLAMRGRKVLLLEREKFPRYHIGESTITGVWPTLDRLGLRERMEHLGFVRKYGASVLWGSDDACWGFLFRETGKYEYTYQVPRAEFDTLLLGRARELGVQVVEDATVKDAVFDGDRMTGLRYQLRGADTVTEVRSRITIDASGQQHWLARNLDIVEWHEDLKNIAVWGYYQGCRRYEGEKAGHTLVENLKGGWLWFIPMANDVTSVGYVTPTSVMTKSGKTIEELFAAAIEGSIEVEPMMKGSMRSSGYRTARDWSYTCTRFHGEGWALVGDAAAFVDPLLSTGVGLAVRGARIVADAVGHALDHPEAERRALQAYEDNSRAYLTVILDFVRFFYDMTKSRAEYYQGAQDISDPEQYEEPEFDFVKLVSGLARDDELVIPNE